MNKEIEDLRSDMVTENSKLSERIKLLEDKLDAFMRLPDMPRKGKEDKEEQEIPVDEPIKSKGYPVFVSVDTAIDGEKYACINPECKTGYFGFNAKYVFEDKEGIKHPKYGKECKFCKEHKKTKTENKINGEYYTCSTKGCDGLVKFNSEKPQFTTCYKNCYKGAK